MCKIMSHIDPWGLSILSNKRSKIYQNDGKTTHLSVAKSTLTTIYSWSLIAFSEKWMV